MYTSYGGVKSGLTGDDSAGIQAIYGGGRTPDRYESTGAGESFATAVNLSSQVNATTLTALVTGLDVTTTSDVDYYTFTAPAGTTGAFTVQLQSKGLSLLAPKMTAYAANQSTVLGAAVNTGESGATLSLTVNHVTAGEQFYVKVQGANTTAFGTGAYALTLNFGCGASPTVPLPDTETPNGTPLSDGGGQAVDRNEAPLAPPGAVLGSTRRKHSGNLPEKRPWVPCHCARGFRDGAGARRAPRGCRLRSWKRVSSWPPPSGRASSSPWP
jgi:hypothetical protein